MGVTSYMVIDQPSLSPKRPLFSIAEISTPDHKYKTIEILSEIDAVPEVFFKRKINILFYHSFDFIDKQELSNVSHIASVTRINTQLGLPHKIEELRLIRPPSRPYEFKKENLVQRSVEILTSVLRPRIRPNFSNANYVSLAPADITFSEQAASNEVIDLEKNTSNERSVEVLLSAFRPLARPKNSAVERVGNSDLQSVAVIVPEIDNTVRSMSSVKVKRSGSCASAMSKEIPRRRGSAKSGAVVLKQIQNLEGTQRDQILEREIRSGNIPKFLRKLVPITITGKDTSNQLVQITICVMPDYIAVGSARDFVRVPMGLNAAIRISNDFEMILPTPRMVDLFYSLAEVKLTPSPMKPGAAMTSTGYFQRHNLIVENQRRRVGAMPGMLVSGHKKDLVLTRRLHTKRGRVAIYGWQRRNGQPIQPLSTVHGAHYADYSHGIRLVSRRALLNGKKTDLRTLMKDPHYASLLTDEGALPSLVFASK